MNAIQTLFEHAECRRLVAALACTLWTAPLAAFALWGTLRFLPARQANLRYVVSLAALLVAALTLPASWTAMKNSERSQHAPPVAEADAFIATASASKAPDASATQQSHVPEQSTVAPKSRSLLADWAPLAAGAWLTGVIFMAFRMFVAIASVRRLRNEPTLDCEIVKDAVERLKRRMGVMRPIRAVTSDRLAAPAVFGIFKPVLVLPTSVVTGTPVHEIEAILAHELAHIRRYDSLVDLFQMLIESLLYFNPAVWWLSRRVRQEREACADAVAVRATGYPGDFARLLAAWAERAGAHPAPSAVAAFADRSQPIADRIRRILMPDHLPRTRISPAAFLTLAIVGAVVLAGLYQGTSVAVALVIQKLSPQERIERIEKIQSEFETVDENLPRDAKTKLEGTIRTFDGAPLPKRVQLALKTERRQISHSISLSAPNGKISREIPFGTTYLRVEAEGYAPAFVGPYHPKEAGETIDLGEIVLEHGYIGRVLVKSKTDGAPVANAKIRGNVPLQGSFPVREWTTDDNGRFVIENAVDRGYKFTVIAPGYQIERLEDFELSRDSQVTLTIAPARPTTGRLIDENGAPIDGAELRVYAELSNGRTYMDRENGRILAVADEDGRFVLDTLHDDWAYAVLVTWGDGRRHLISDIKPGQKDLTIVTPPRLHVTGRLVGDLDRLTASDGKAELRYSQRVSIGDQQTGIAGKADVEIKEDPQTGRRQGAFRIDDALSGRIDLRIPGRGEIQRIMVTDRPVEDVVIDLGSEPAETSMRKAVFVFQPPDDGVVPQGSVRIYDRNRSYDSGQPGDVIELKDGKAEFEIAAPGTAFITSQAIPGYWFDDKSHEIPSGDGPWETEIRLRPAGALYGKVTQDSGQPLPSNVSVSARLVRNGVRQDDIPHSMAFPQSVSTDAQGRFYIGPLPLGTRYALRVGRGKYNVVTKPVTMDAGQPTQEVNVVLGKGVDCAIQAVDEAGRPIAGAPAKLSFEHPHASVGYGSPIRTDVDGRAVFEDLNPRESYLVRLEFKKDYVPTVPNQLRKDGQTLVIRAERGRTIEGVLLDQAGRPVLGVELYATIAEPEDRHVRCEAERLTDKDGRFRFSNLPDAVMRIGAVGVQLTEDRQFRPGVADATLHVRGEG